MKNCELCWWFRAEFCPLKQPSWLGKRGPRVCCLTVGGEQALGLGPHPAGAVGLSLRKLSPLRRHTCGCSTARAASEPSSSAPGDELDGGAVLAEAPPLRTPLLAVQMHRSPVPASGFSVSVMLGRATYSCSSSGFSVSTPRMLSHLPRGGTTRVSSPHSFHFFTSST